MLLVWKVNVGDLSLGNATCFHPMSKRRIFVKLCWRQLKEQREKTSWPSFHEQQGWAYATDLFTGACCKRCLPTLDLFASFEPVHKNNLCAINRLCHSAPPLHGMLPMVSPGITNQLKDSRQAEQKVRELNWTKGLVVWTWKLVQCSFNARYGTCKSSSEPFGQLISTLRLALLGGESLDMPGTHPSCWPTSTVRCK